MYKKPVVLLLFLGVLLVVVRVLVHIYFTGVYVDSDQTISWLSAVDKANGEWYTPYFYGQFYNISITSILSAPFIAAGLKVQHVVPIVSNIIGAMPFLFGALFLYRQGWINTAIILLCLGLILPAQYHFVTAMARGFAGGLATLSIGLWLTSYKSVFIKSIGYMLVWAAYFINPNVLIILAPLSLVWLLNQYTQKGKFSFKRLTPQLIGAGLSLILFLWIQSFNNSNYAVHNLWDLKLGADYFLNSIQSLDTRFLYLFPFMPKTGSLLLVLLALITVFMVIRKQRREAIVMSLCLLFVLVTLGLNKTGDGSDSTFFPYSRMYLALPYVAVVGLYLLVRGRKLNNAFYLVVAIVASVGFVYQLTDIPSKAKISVRGNSGVVQVLTIDKLCLECEKMKKFQKKYQADILVYHYKTDEYNYGCKALQPEMTTLYPEYDRRYWTFINHADTVYPTILFMDWSLLLPQQLTQTTGNLEAIKDIHYPAFLLTNNTQSIIDLYESNNLPLRPYSK